MRSIKAKRIAAVAASLLVGLAFASQGVNFGNVPIINNQGQPVVQIVLGSQAKPSDGVVAANIAAVIGSLAHTTQNITAYVSGKSGISCVVTTPTCTLTNQQVYLGEKGLVVPAGSYSFSALIGSVLNPGVLSSGNLVNTKSVLSTSGSFDYPDSTTSPYSITSTPTATSVYTGLSSGISPSTSVSATNNGGGVTFTRFTNNGFDNILQLTSSQVPGLLSSAGTYQESESLWLAGFPVYNQNSGQLSVLDTNGAYQISFGKPIQNVATTGQISAQFSLLGSNWTVYNMTPATVSGVSSSNFVVGGSATFAQSSTPVETIYVGQNISTGPFKVVLSDLSYPNANGVANAGLSIYKNGVLTNVTSAGPATTPSIVVNASGTKLYLTVSQTFPGLYAYQKWAKIQLFSNTFTVKSGSNFNTANGNNWLAALRWTTNQSSSGAETTANAALQGIILYSNQSSQMTLTPGSSMTYITNPAKWNVNFVGDSLGAPSSGNANYDALQLSTSNKGGQYVSYSNGQTGLVTPSYQTVSTTGTLSAGATLKQINETVVTEPVNLFSVSSSIPTAFQINSGSYAAPTSNLQTLDYNLNPYTFAASNAIDAPGLANVIASGVGGLVFQLNNNGVNGNYVTSSNPLTVYVTGYRQVGSTSTTTYSVSFNGFNTQTLQGDYLTNATNIELGSALPAPGANVLVYETANTANGINANAVLMGTLTPSSTPTLLYQVPQYSYYIAPPVDTATYTGEQNNVNFALGTSTTPDNTVARGTYFTYTMPEITVPSSSTANANVIIGITNSSSVTSTAPLYWLNETNGNNNAVEYQSSQNVQTKAVQGFRTERGGEVGSIGTASLTYYEPKSVDGLEFLVGGATNNAINASNIKMYGPYTVGQATNIANVTIGSVNATCAFSTTSCNITGLKNLTAVPSVTSAVVGSPLNTVNVPIAVLDSGVTNNSTNQIVIGSGYVNSVAQSIFNQNSNLNKTFGTNSTIVAAYGNKILVAGYTAQQTINAGNQFIQTLLQDASTS